MTSDFRSGYAPRGPSLSDLVADPARVQDLEGEHAPQVLAQVSALVLALAGRMAEVAGPSKPPGRPALNDPSGQSRWLSPKQAAELCGVSKRQIYSWSRRADWRPFTTRPSRKTLRVEESGLQRWFKTQGQRRGLPPTW
jgi:hypothetical protein